MKPNLKWLVVASVVIVAGCKSEPPVTPEPTASILSAVGEVSYATDGVFNSLRAGKTLPSGAVIRTGKNSHVDLRINGVSTIRLEKNSFLELTTIESASDPTGEHHNTVLTLQGGILLGDALVQNRSSDAYAVRTPNGEARVQEPRAVFKVAVIDSQTGPRTISYGAAIGQLLVSATVDSQITNATVNFSEEWTPGAGAVRTNASLIAECDELRAASAMNHAPQPAPPPPLVQPFNGFRAPFKRAAQDIDERPFARRHISWGRGLNPCAAPAHTK